MKLRFLGHNAWHLTVESLSILIDPFLSSNSLAACSPDSLQADFILVSHGHGDHFGDTISIAKRTGAIVVSIAEIVSYCTQQGVKSTLAMNLGGSVQLPFGKVKMVPAIHSSTLPDGTPGGSPVGFLITLKGGLRLYFACDTALFSDMKFFSGVDYAALPIGDLFTMGPDDALEAVKIIHPRNVIPCHYGTWPPINQDVQAWKVRVEKETLSKCVVMKSGEELSLVNSLLR